MLKELTLLVNNTPLICINVSDIFIYTGGLKSCPEWMIELVEDEKAIIFPNKNLLIRWENGSIIAEPDDIVIRFDGPKDFYSYNYCVIHAKGRVTEAVVTNEENDGSPR